jgi:diguanylate cyclase (GGDEF)-like protein
LLFDPQGKILIGDDEHAAGTQIPASLKAGAAPVVVNSKLQAWAVPRSTPNLTAREQRYLSAIDQAVLVAMGLAFVLALVLGVLVGNRLGGDLRVLTFAIQAIGRGELRQQVRIRSRDEIGILANAFNRMSADLARAQEDLQQSTAQIGAQAELLKELSIRDGLTRLYNRRHFDEQAATMFAQARRSEHPLTLVIADLDHFKRINDGFSHATGDEVLRKVAFLLQSSLRQSDVVARYGGEEFVIALYRTPLGKAAHLCDKLRSIVEEHPWHEIHPDLKVTMSFGLTDDLGLGGFEKMLAQADRQLYRAKESGRNQVCFDEAAGDRIPQGRS